MGMTIAVIVAAVVVAGAVVGLALWLTSQQGRTQNSMQQQITALREEVSRSLSESSRQSREQVAQLSSQLNERMKETSSTLNTTQTTVGDRLDNAARVIGALQNKLGALEENSRRILEVGQGLAELKDIMKNPKLRGNMGEFFLEDLLRQILPADRYDTQYGFRSGETVDAVIHLGEKMLCIDSKFPLESFARMLKLPDDQPEEKRREKKAFVAAIKKHAEAIAKKYIVQNENTFDFAFMYIPAENVYYETIIRDDLIEDEGSLYSFLLAKKVIPVSPNSLYAYLQVIVLGLKGLKIQESAKVIMQEMDRLGGDLEKFRDEFAVLGKHLKNASGSYDEGAKRMDKFQTRYGQLTDNKQQLEIGGPTA